MRSVSYHLARAAVIVSTLWILIGFAAAQSGQVPPPPPAKLRFLFLDETAGHYALKVGKEAYRQVSSAPYEISSPFTPAGPEVIEIYKVAPTPDPTTGLARRVKIATFAPPTNTPSALVVVTPRPPAAPDAPLDFRVEIIDCNPRDFPGGSIRIINRGRVPMGALLGPQRVITAPGESKVVKPQTDSRHRVLSKIAAQEPEGWKLLSDNIMIVRPRSRVFGIFVFSPSGLRHTLTPGEIAEFGPPPPGHFWLTFSDSP